MKQKIFETYEYKIIGKKRTRCPKCHKLGIKFVYKNPPPYGIYKHKVEINSSGIPEVVEYCYLDKEDL